jgi:hypothetical protein
MTEPTPPSREPPFTLQLGPDSFYVRIDDGEEDNTVRKSEEISRRCAELRQQYGDSWSSAPDEPDSIHICLDDGEEDNTVRPSELARELRLRLTEGPDQPQPGPIL